MYNYAFSIGVPYGAVYSNSVYRKLKPNKDRNSLFILSVDPFSIGNIYTDKDGGDKRENHSILANIHCVHHNPNIEHIFEQQMFKRSFYSQRKRGYIDECGRVITFRSSTEDESVVKERVDNFILPYYNNDVLPTYHQSQERVEELRTLIRKLSDNGDVFLVRLPVDISFNDIFDAIYPTFDLDMYRLAEEEDVNYISFTKDCAVYKTTDWVHMYETEGDKFTYALCDSIKNIRLNNNKSCQQQ